VQPIDWLCSVFGFKLGALAGRDRHAADTDGIAEVAVVARMAVTGMGHRRSPVSGVMAASAEWPSMLASCIATEATSATITTPARAPERLSPFSKPSTFDAVVAISSVMQSACRIRAALLSKMSHS
jgi:hypothetical protein